MKDNMISQKEALIELGKRIKNIGTCWQAPWSLLWCMLYYHCIFQSL